MNTRLMAAFVAALLSGACGSHYVARGADLYAGGHYIEAAEVFERTEPRLDASSEEERARYGLYRGATLLALGDLPRAELWLAYSKKAARTDDGALSSDERVMLDRALTALAKRPHLAHPAAEGPTVAATERLPPAAVSPAAPAAAAAEAVDAPLLAPR